MMRPMFVEFPEERTCEVLDCQYMLGDSLLVAPIFKESGEVEYYLPEGKWWNLLNEKTVIGGKWQKETHNYFSLPLMVRPGSIIAVGADTDKPDYDFARDVKLLLYFPEDGIDGETSVTDKKGNIIFTAQAKRRGKEICLSLRGNTDNLGISFQVLGEKDLTVNL